MKAWCLILHRAFINDLYIQGKRGYYIIKWLYISEFHNSNQVGNYQLPIREQIVTNKGTGSSLVRNQGELIAG